MYSSQKKNHNLYVRMGGRSKTAATLKLIRGATQGV